MKWKNGEEENTFLRKEEVERIHKTMFDQQKKWTANWKDIRDYINPNIGFFDGDTPNDGGRQDFEMINTAPIEANNTQAAGMQNGITSPTRPWVRITDPDPDIQELEEVRYWCDDVTQLIHDVLSRSNFYNSAHQFYRELGGPSTAAMMIVEDDETDIRCRTFTIGEYAIGCDHAGRVNRFARNMQMTVAEVVGMFGKAACPLQVKQLFENKNYDAYIKVKHLILPNELAQAGKIDKWNKPYLSLYWCQECPGEEYLDIGGYEEWPVPCARWDIKGADVYGRGPGWYALGDAKSLQAIEEDVHIGVKKMVDPPLTAPTDILSAGGVNSLPNGVTYYPREMGESSIRAAYQVNIDITGAQVLKQEKIDAIRRHFFYDMFRMLEALDKGQITAREVIERVQEKMSLIGPVLDRLQSEFLRPVIDRVFGIMLRRGLIPDPPEIMIGRELKIEYTSVMAQAQKMSGLTAIEQLAAFIGNIAAVDPTVMDKWDRDETIDQYAEMLGSPPSLIISDDKVAQIRAARAQQQQAQQMAQMAMTAAQGAETLSKADMGGNNALSALLGGQVQ